MTLTIAPPTAPALSPQRDAPAPAATTTAAARADLPSALKPIDAKAKTDALPPDDRHERPSGPPPAFDVSVLQEIQERLRDPVTGDARRAAGDLPGDLAAQRQAAEPRAQQLDRKS